MKLKNFSLLLTLLLPFLCLQVSAQNPDSLSMPDGPVTGTQENTDLKSREPEDLQGKKDELHSRNSVEVYAEVSGKNRNSITQYLKDGLEVLKSIDLNFNFDLNLDNDLHELVKKDSKISRVFNDQKIEKTKVISKSYPVDRNDKLRISNRYGKVTVNTWEKNEIKVDIEIKARATSESAAQQSLDRVHINESKQANLISFETVFDPVNSRLFSSGGNVQREVNYTVYMPSVNPLDLKNSYGNTQLPDLEGLVEFHGSYGNLNAGNLSGANNAISVKYGGATIKSLRSGSLDIGYGSLNMVNAGTLDAGISYSHVKIDRVSGDINLNLRYSGGLRIDKIDATVKKVDIDASYSSMSLGFDPASDFNFDVSANYSAFSYNKALVTVTSSETSGNRKHYSGKYGKGSDASVTIHSNYGSIRFQ